ncbi:flagellin, partial [mine drainage metagenome]
PANSVTLRFPILSHDDVVGLMINVTNTFGYNITQGSLLTGQLIIPVGTPAIIDLTAPNDFSTKTITLE